jgi:hypothetical protein
MCDNSEHYFLVIWSGTPESASRSLWESEDLTRAHFKDQVRSGDFGQKISTITSSSKVYTRIAFEHNWTKLREVSSDLVQI